MAAKKAINVMLYAPTRETETHVVTTIVVIVVHLLLFLPPLGLIAIAAEAVCLC